MRDLKKKIQQRQIYYKFPLLLIAQIRTTSLLRTTRHTLSEKISFSTDFYDQLLKAIGATEIIFQGNYKSEGWTLLSRCLCTVTEKTFISTNIYDICLHFPLTELIFLNLLYTDISYEACSVLHGLFRLFWHFIFTTF